MADEEATRRADLAEDLLELCANPNFLNLILRQDRFAKEVVEVVLFEGERDDLQEMEFGEELILRVDRSQETCVLVARQFLENVSCLFRDYYDLPSGRVEVVRKKAEEVFGGQYEVVRVEEWIGGEGYEVTLERMITSPEELILTHGSVIEEIMKTLLGN